MPPSTPRSFITHVAVAQCCSAPYIVQVPCWHACHACKRQPVLVSPAVPELINATPLRGRVVPRLVVAGRKKAA